jgi:hypothetical protein
MSVSEEFKNRDTYHFFEMRHGNVRSTFQCWQNLVEKVTGIKIEFALMIAQN